MYGFSYMTCNNLIGCYVDMGFVQGYQPLASYAFGAKNNERFHQSVGFAL